MGTGALTVPIATWVNARGNSMFPDWQLNVGGQTSVIDITTPGQAGKALDHPATTVMEPLTGTSAPSISAPICLPGAVARQLPGYTQAEIDAQACFMR
jgi:hypothetical protein